MGTLRRPTLVPGIYDEVVTERVDAELSRLDANLAVVRQALGKTEAVASPLSALLRDAVDLALDSLEAEDSVKLSEAVLNVLHQHAPSAFRRSSELALKRERLLAIVEKPAEPPPRPKGSLHTSSLIVNAENDSL